jgi:hypothetical protein
MNLRCWIRRHAGKRPLLVVAGLLLLCASCGIKGPPVAVKEPVPPPVTDLKAERIGAELLLSWSLPKQDGAVFSGLEEFKIYKYQSHRSTDWCPDCPIPFSRFLTVGFLDPWPARREGDRIFFKDTVEADYRYAYKVVVCHRSGAVSKDSNIAFWPEQDRQVGNDES